MISLSVTPFDPMLKQEPVSDLGLNLTLFGLFILGLITIIRTALRIDLRAERDPLAVGRPYRSTGTGRYVGHLFLVAAIGLHRPDLTAGRECDPLAVRRPTWAATRRRSVGQLLSSAAISRHCIDLAERAVSVLIDDSDGECDGLAIWRELWICNTFEVDQIVDRKRPLGVRRKSDRENYSDR